MMTGQHKSQGRRGGGTNPPHWVDEATWGGVLPRPGRRSKRRGEGLGEEVARPRARLGGHSSVQLRKFVMPCHGITN